MGLASSLPDEGRLQKVSHSATQLCSLQLEFETTLAHALLLQRRNYLVHDPILLWVVWDVELLLQATAALQANVVAVGEHQQLPDRGSRGAAGSCRAPHSITNARLSQPS